MPVAPQLVGVIHLPPLPGSPQNKLSMQDCVAQARACAKALWTASYGEIIIENFGDAPFFAGKVPPITIAAMTACAVAVREEAKLALIGINVLRNDAEAALSIAHVIGGRFVRINVHMGARVTDQGVIQGDAATTLRFRRELLGASVAADAESIAIWADVDVKHSAPLGPPRPIEQEVEDLTKRGMAGAVLVTGDGTGKGVDMEKLAAVKTAAGANVPVLVASGATIETLGALRKYGADGVIVGSAIRRDGIAGRPVDADLAKAFREAWTRDFATP